MKQLFRFFGLFIRVLFNSFHENFPVSTLLDKSFHTSHLLAALNKDRGFMGGWGGAAALCGKDRVKEDLSMRVLPFSYSSTEIKSQTAGCLLGIQAPTTQLPIFQVFNFGNVG